MPIINLKYVKCFNINNITCIFTDGIGDILSKLCCCFKPSSLMTSFSASSALGAI